MSVVLPVRNGEPFLRRAIDSMCSQTLDDLEVIVVENGSTDATLDIAQALARHDDRVIVHSIGDVGLVGALNAGLRLARGEFIARMDADDVSHPSRLQRQVDLLRADPSLIAAGTSYRYVDEQGSTLGERHVPTRPEHVAAAFHFGNPIAHPSVMFAPHRISSQLEYSTDFPDAEDFELWIRLAAHGRLANLDAVLLEHRVHDASVSASSGRGGRSSVDALVAASRLPPGLARWIHDRTFNAVQTGVDPFSFVIAVVALNVCSLLRPTERRRSLTRASAVAVASYVRRRTIRRTPGFGAPSEGNR